MGRYAHVILCAVATTIFLSVNPLLTVSPSFGPTVSLAQEGWKAEYDSVSSKTDVAMTLPKEELNGLIARCDKLEPQIEKKEKSNRQVYLRRLQMYRELYQYVLENKEHK